MRSIIKINLIQVVLVCSVFLWTSPFLWAQAESVTPGAEVRRAVHLRDLLDMARQRSPGLKVKKYEYEAARSKVIGAFLPMDPMIGVDVEGQPDLFDFGGRVDNEYMLLQTIPFPTKLFLKGTIASKAADIAFQKYLEEERQVRWHIEQPYYEMFLAQKTLEALEENQSLLEKLSQAVKARYESNQVPQEDLLKAQIELSKNAIEVFNWRERVHIQEAHFSHQLDESLATQYVLVNDGERTPFPYDRDALEKAALLKRPELKALEIGIRRARDNRSLVTTEWLPDITLKYEGRDFRGQGGGITEHDTFIGLTVPVWSLIAGIGGVWKSSEDEVKAAEAMYTEMKNEVFLALHVAYSRARAADNALRIYENSILPQARQQVEVALASYEAVRTDFLTVIDAQRTLKNTLIEYYRAVAEYELALSDLRLAVGDDLTRIEGGLS